MACMVQSQMIVRHFNELIAQRAIMLPQCRKLIEVNENMQLLWLAKMVEQEQQCDQNQGLCLVNIKML